MTKVLQATDCSSSAAVQEDESSPIPPPFAKLNVDHLTKDELENIGVTVVPTLCFVFRRNGGAGDDDDDDNDDEDILTLEWSGKAATPKDILTNV